MSGCFKKRVFVFLIGASVYPCIEIIWRGRTHPTMSVLGGICFCSICEISKLMKNKSYAKKCAVGAVSITLAEFVSGMILNEAMGLKIWDYSPLPLNVRGQICLPYCILWYLLCIPSFRLSEKIERIRF